MLGDYLRKLDSFSFKWLIGRITINLSTVIKWKWRYRGAGAEAHTQGPCGPGWLKEIANKGRGK